MRASTILMALFFVAVCFLAVLAMESEGVAAAQIPNGDGDMSGGYDLLKLLRSERTSIFRNSINFIIKEKRCSRLSVWLQGIQNSRIQHGTGSRMEFYWIRNPVY